MLVGKNHSQEDSLLLNELSRKSYYAFKILYEKYWSDVLDEAYKRLDDLDQAKDIVQEVFAYLWTKSDTLEIKNLPAWLTTVTKNQVFSFLKKQQRFVPLTEIFAELESFGDDSDAKLLRAELAKAYKALIDALPEQQRIIFNMRYNDDLSSEKIAEQLNLSPKTVRNHLGRALSRLKTNIFFLHIILFISQK
jgi:RNA polymerase sigma-70 factor (family 1)